MEISVIPAASVFMEIADFYKVYSGSQRLEAKDELVVARAHHSFVGSVRLCQENGLYTLRSMQIADAHQRQGIGQRILNRFKERLEEKNIPEAFCIPYAHLEKFYSSIGFQKIENEQAPEFLQERLKEYSQRRPETSFIVMKWSRSL